MRMHAFLALLAAVICSSDASAQALDDIPPALKPWVPWVHAQDENARCPLRDGRALCFWPGTLALDLGEQDGRFAFEVLSDRRLLVRLPGSTGRWPQAVRVGGKTAPVIARDSVPVLDLPAGEHRIEGRFVWPRLPERLAVPPEIGQIKLMLAGKPVAHPKRDEAGSLWLQRTAADKGPAELELNVQRKIEDAIPLRVETRIRVRAAGEPREVSLGNVLLDGTLPMSIDAQLPVRLDANGELRAQIRAGSYALRIVARTLGPVSELSSRARPAPWPTQEAWSFQPDPALRQVRVEGAAPADPARLELDRDLQNLPTFLLQQTDKLTLTDVRRGEPEPAPNELSLSRRLWLDQDGRGYTVHDTLHGQLHSGFRLDLTEGKLGRAAQMSQDQLITQRKAAGPLGVELRDVSITLNADSRLDEHLGSLPAVGWSEDVRSLDIVLNLPPGYTLWSASGVDRVDHSWLSDWDLLGFFFVLVIAFGTGSIAGRWAGVLALVTLGLTYQEADAPGPVLLSLLVAAALLRVLPSGRLWQVVRVAFAFGLLSLVLVFLPFATRSLREAFYPQLAEHRQVSYGLESPPAEPTAAPAPGEALGNDPMSSLGAVMGEAVNKDFDLRERGLGGKAEEGSYPQPKSGYARQQARTKQDPDAVVQTGPGLPDWQFQSWRLSWSGPVAHDHRFELVILPPLVNRALSVLRVLLCAALAWLIVAAAGAFRKPPPTAAALVLLALAGPASVHAQFPEQALLDQLRTRVEHSPDCRPQCVRVADLDVYVGPEGLTLQAEVHAQDRTSVRVPGPLALWAPERVQVDGKDARMIALDDGFLHVRVLPGVSVLRVSGALPATETLTLRLGDQPAHLQVRTSGYEVSGVREDGTSEDAIELRRLLTEQGERTTVSLPPWFSVTRSFELATEFRVTTRVERETPLGTPTLVHLPLLAAESVHDSRIQVRDRTAIVAFGPDDKQVLFVSTLAQANQIELVAGQHATHSERWVIGCASMWACEASGLVPVSHETDGQWRPAYRPWPGERLKLALSKPAPAPGQSTTIDAAKLLVRPGVRATDGQLTVSLRTSRGGDHKLWLPEAARLKSFSIGGARLPVQRDGAAIGFSTLPGRAEIVADFELPTGMENVMTAPQVKLDTPARNARVLVEPPQDRWLLWVHGPSWGPAILFWGYLLLVVGVALCLGRLRSAQLRTLDWLLLGLGLTQTDAAAALCVVGFFFLVGFRERTTQLSTFRHNALQLGFVIWTFAFASALFDAVQSGLLVQPDMQVMGTDCSSSSLVWYVDDSGTTLPTPTLISVPLWIYRVLMLVWSLWLARQLLRWAPRALRAFMAGGIWKKRVKPQPPPPPPAAPVAST
jgi:hypothetical protein